MQRAAKGTLAVVQEHIDAAARGEVGDVVRGQGEVHPPVAVEVARDHEPGLGAGGDEDGVLERAVAIAPQDAHAAAVGDGAAPVVGDDQVQPVIAIKVGQRNGPGPRAGGVGDWVDKRAVGDALGDGHRVVPRVDRHEVGDAVAVKVSRGHGGRVPADHAGGRQA